MNQFVQVLVDRTVSHPDGSDVANSIGLCDLPGRTHGHGLDQQCLRQADCLIVLRNGDDERPTALPDALETAATSGVFRRRRAVQQYV